SRLNVSLLDYLFLFLALMARAQNKLVGLFVGPRLLALGRLAPRTDRMTAARGTPFATAMRMVDRVHGHAAVMRALALPYRAAGLAEIDVAMVRIGHGADRCHAKTADDALLTRIEAQDRHALVTADQLRVGTGRTGDLGAL